jgi:hypothetical protein
MWPYRLRPIITQNTLASDHHWPGVSLRTWTSERGKHRDPVGRHQRQTWSCINRGESIQIARPGLSSFGEVITHRCQEESTGRWRVDPSPLFFLSNLLDLSTRSRFFFSSRFSVKDQVQGAFLTSLPAPPLQVRYTGKSKHVLRSDSPQDAAPTSCWRILWRSPNGFVLVSLVH